MFTKHRKMQIKRESQPQGQPAITVLGTRWESGLRIAAGSVGKATGELKKSKTIA